MLHCVSIHVAFFVSVFMLLCVSIHVALGQYSCYTGSVFMLHWVSTHVALGQYSCCIGSVLMLYWVSTHVALGQYLVFHEIKRTLLHTLGDRISHSFLSRLLCIVFRVLKKSHE